MPMKKNLSLLMILLFVTTLASCSLTEKNLKETGAKLLGQQALVEIFSQDRVVTRSTKSGSAKGYYSPDGTQKIKWQGGGDEGTYKIINGEFCSKWNATRSGKEECYRIYQTEDNEYVWFKLDGSYDSKMVIIK